MTVPLYYNKLYSESKILDVRQLYFFCTCVKYHANKHKALLPSHQYFTRRIGHYVTPWMLKVATKRSYDSFALYNPIPEGIIRQQLTLELSKKNLKHMFLKSEEIIWKDCLNRWLFHSFNFLILCECYNFYFLYVNVIYLCNLIC